jgi:dTDP-4-amino-4,6-dideoxygalactose transaminase
LKEGNKSIYVTRPVLPPLDEFVKYLGDIWKSGWLTNNGRYHQELERELCRYLGVKYCSLFANGTLALIVGLQALKITGEVITTPFSFVATTHSLWWNGIKPVFCDIEEKTLCLNPEKIEALINPRTTAILPVHVYGHPCDVKRINRIAKTYGLKVIYDAAHAFGVKIKGNSILNYGDISILSFHATKVFNTIEGGAIVTNSKEIKKRVDFLKNFGFADEVTVVGPGINAKMNEVQAAYGLLQLKGIARAINRRKKVAGIYRRRLKNISGIRFFSDASGVEENYSHFPILIDQKEYGKSRDEVYEIFKRRNIYTRRYFYPLISAFSPYKDLPSASLKNLPVAEKIAKQVLCLPIYSDLAPKDTERICDILVSLT